MKNPIGCFIVLLFLSGCDKQKSNLNKIDGKWNVVQYSLTNNEGLTSKFSNCIGTIYFMAENAQFDLNSIHQNNGLYDTTAASGNFQLNENGSSIIFNNSIGLNLGYEGNYRILTLTSTDLQIEGGDTLGNIHTYLFSRK